MIKPSTAFAVAEIPVRLLEAVNVYRSDSAANYLTEHLEAYLEALVRKFDAEHTNVLELMRDSEFVLTLTAQPRGTHASGGGLVGDLHS